jgi:hypothetical protein
VSFVPLTAEQILQRLNTPGVWQEMTSDFPDKMRSISGKLGDDLWIVVEHEPFPGQTVDMGYDGTFTTPPAHMYRLPYDVAKAAYLKGRAYLDSQAKQNG